MNAQCSPAFALICLLPLLGGSFPAGAQPVRTRILEGFKITRTQQGFQLELQLNVPLQYRWHSPENRGDSIRIKVDPLRVAPDDVLPALNSESLSLPRDLPIPLTEVTYEGDAGDGPYLEVRFSKPVEFRVRQGRDFRSLVLSIEQKHGRIYAVQLDAAPLSAPHTALPRSDLIARYILYAARFSQKGESWRRLRLGFFGSSTEAERVAAQIRRHFPDAFVVEVSSHERDAARRHPLSFATRRPRTRQGTTEAPKPTAPPESTPPSTPSAVLMEEGREALTSGQIDKAIAIFGEVASLPESPATIEARELLGLSRERNGQLAHAKAEYEDYLRRYPDGEAADRVRQRLNTLLTADDAPMKPRAKSGTPTQPYEFRTFGSLFSSYRRESRTFDDLGETLADSSLFTDLFAEVRLENAGYAFRGQASGGYRRDFIDDGGETRINTLFVDVTDLQRDISGFIGRRSQSTGGVLGRFDGGRIAHRFAGSWEAAVTGGFPVQSPTLHAIDGEKSFVGGSLAWEGFADSIESELFFLYQMREEQTDRMALGGELRYFDSGRYVYAYLDYDVHFESLNIAQLVGNWQVTDATFLNLTIDYRNSPILSLSNALQGQLVGSIGNLLDLFSLGAAEALALDRTAKSLSLTGGVGRRISSRLQLSFDFTATDLSGTPGSGGVEPLDGSGFEFSYFTQLIANGLLSDGDLGILGLRIFDGSTADIFTVTLDGRYPLTKRFRVNPRLRTEYRWNDRSADIVTISPSLRLDYRVLELKLEAESGVDWMGRSDDQVADEWGYFAYAGVRLDF